MFSQRLFLQDLIPGIRNVTSRCLSTNNGIKTEKVLVVSKLSRFEFEKKKFKDLTNNQVLDTLRQRGTDIEKMIRYHDLHKKFEENVVNTFENLGVSVKVVNRYSYTPEDVANADVVIPTGGDGTFLLAASMINDNKKPVIGLNSDPNRSEGYLCLPKRYSTNVRDAVERLNKGDFTWLMRSRIRTTLLVCGEQNLVPKYLHDSEFDCFPRQTDGIAKEKVSKVLPCLALNENVAELLRLIDIDPTEGKDSLATVLSDIYNKNLIFNADDRRMSYTIRELISAAVWPDPKGIKPRGFARKIEIKSNCFEASLVIDGGVSFSFNDGTTALLEIRPEDALRTVVF
ncbi:hypothetical protein HUJ05_013228 [Dendroctonus ponderosae]|nr:hypothetical protein HUJ05_013228 [Dendroctonus ponderosae]